MNDMMLRCEGISKEYRLGAIGGTTLREDLQRLGAKIRKKEDPTSVIGEGRTSKNGRFLALDGITFEVKRGEAVGIIGHNGAGKSTLLKLITRVTGPSSGNIFLNGRVASMLEIGTGFHPELTGRENIYMNGAILGMTKGEISAKLDKIIEFSEISEFIDTPVKRYSSGMYVKLAFSVAAHLDSEIVIMDEVLAVGDVAFQNKCITKMREAATLEGKTVLYVSHNMNTIRQLCTRVIVLDKGRLVFDGDVEKGIEKYMERICGSREKHVSLSSMERPDGLIGGVRFQQIELIDCENCIVKDGRLNFKIAFKAEREVRDLKFRILLRSNDDIPVGLARSEILGSFSDEDGVCERSLSLDTSFLAKGVYWLSVSLIQSDDMGNPSFLDHIARACSIEILGGENGYEDNDWSHRYYGYIDFPTIKVIK